MLLSGTVVADPGTVHDPGAVVVDGDRIAAVGDRDRLLDVYPDHERRELDLVAPGLVAAHVHAVQSVARGRSHDEPLAGWLDAVLPVEAALSPGEVRTAATLGYLELLRNGATTVVDHPTVSHAGEAIDAAADLGLRGRFGKVVATEADVVPDAMAQPAATAVTESEQLLRRYHDSHGGRVKYALTPRFPLGCSRPCLESLAALADDHDGVLVHTHAAETEREVAATRRKHGARPVELLADVGLTGPDALVAHAVHTSRAERDHLADSGTSVVHCPSANMKLGSGVAPVPALRSRGVEVAVGNDGPPCNDALDPFTELRQAALLARVAEEDAAAVTASGALRMATLAGARAAGFEQVGALRAGWAADLVGLRTDHPRGTPLRDPVGHLVFDARGADVALSMVDGEVVVEDGSVVGVDEAAVRERAAALADRLDAELAGE